MTRPPPFEPLPTDRPTARRRGVRDGLIIAGWMACAVVPLMVVPMVQSLGYDAFAYWAVDLADIYGRTPISNYALGAFRYTPPMAYAFAPLGALPWWLFLWLWLALMAACLAFLGGRWALVMLALPPVALELYHGNVNLLIAVAVALGFRHPWTWSFVLLTKMTPGVGLLWFVVRREWRQLGIALGATAAIAGVTFVAAPQVWLDFVGVMVGNLGLPQAYSVPPALPVRLPLAALLVIWGARTDRPWTVGVAAAMALPIIWVYGLTVALAAVPFLRRGDRAALQPDWLAAASLRRLLVLLAAFLGGALLLAVLFGEPLGELLEWASAGLDVELRRP